LLLLVAASVASLSNAAHLGEEVESKRSSFQASQSFWVGYTPNPLGEGADRRVGNEDAEVQLMEGGAAQAYASPGQGSAGGSAGKEKAAKAAMASTGKVKNVCGKDTNIMCVYAKDNCGPLPQTPISKIKVEDGQFTTVVHKRADKKGLNKFQVKYYQGKGTFRARCGKFGQVNNVTQAFEPNACEKMFATVGETGYTKDMPLGEGCVKKCKVLFPALQKMAAGRTTDKNKKNAQPCQGCAGLL
jgi:hypothetical protein